MFIYTMQRHGMFIWSVSSTLFCVSLFSVYGTMYYQHTMRSAVIMALNHFWNATSKPQTYLFYLLLPSYYLAISEMQVSGLIKINSIFVVWSIENLSALPVMSSGTTRNTKDQKIVHWNNIHVQFSVCTQCASIFLYDILHT